jgi:predicted small lipoprotein YifL
MRWLLLATIIAQIATCGQKGPLVLPEETRAGAGGEVSGIHRARDDAWGTSRSRAPRSSG